MEAGYARWCDQTWLIGVDDEVAKQRLAESRGMSSQEADQRLKSMRPFEERAPGADWTYRNNGTREELAAAVNAELDRILAIHRSGQRLHSVFPAWWGPYAKKFAERLAAAGTPVPPDIAA